MFVQALDALPDVIAAAASAAIILGNRVYLQRAVRFLRQQGREIDERLLKHVAPIHWNHINLAAEPPRGERSFQPGATVAQGLAYNFPFVKPPHLRMRRPGHRSYQYKNSGSLSANRCFHQTQVAQATILSLTACASNLGLYIGHL
jgi:hypothetical protein